MSNSFFEFKDRQLKLMPLDVNKKVTRAIWIKKNQEKSKWNYISVPSIEFEEFIGKGANGIVFKAIESVSQRKCAVKFWTPHKRSDHYDVNFERYQEEIKKVANLRDSSIVTIYTADKTSNGYCYSTMEWIEGITLKEFLNKKHFKDEARYFILETILRTIVKCHQLDVFHGDLHSENILILNLDLYPYNNYEVKILDFGTSLLNRLNKPAYGKQRESALLLETSLKLLPEEDKYELLKYKFYSSKNATQIKITDINDVRNYHPLLVSTTLGKLNEIYSILETNPVNDFVISDVLDLLVTSTGIDINKFLKYLFSKFDEENKMFHGTFSRTLAYKLNERSFDTDYRDHYKRDVELILCYYELLKKVDSDSKFNDDWNSSNYSEQTFDYSNILHLESLKEVEKWIFKAKKFLNEQQFIAFRDGLFKFLGKKYSKEYQVENQLFQDYDLVTKLNELRLISKEMTEIIKCMTEN